MGLNKNDDSITNLFTFNSVDTKIKAEQTARTETTKAPTQTPIQKPKSLNTDTQIKREYTKHDTTTTNKGLADSNTRTSLVINKDQLFTIDALSSYTKIKKVDVLTQLLQKGLDELKKKQPTLINEALNNYSTITKSLF